MKKKVLGTVLLSTLVLSNLGVAPVVLADVVNSKGTVEVTEGNINPPTPDPDPTNPSNPGDSKDPENPGGGPIIPDIPGGHNPDPTDPGDGFTPGENAGPLAIIGTSNLRFGTIQTSGSSIRKAATSARIWIPSKFNDDLTIADDATFNAKSVGNYVQFGDVRTEANGYQLTAKFTQQFTGDAGTLNNSTIEYTNGVLTHEDAQTPDIHPTLNTTTMTLGLGQSEKVVTLATNNSEGKGKGIYSVEYGQSESIVEDSIVSGTPAKGTEGNSIFLNVPSSTAKNMKVGNYEAIVEWTLTPDVQP